MPGHVLLDEGSKAVVKLKHALQAWRKGEQRSWRPRPEMTEDGECPAVVQARNAQKKAADEQKLREQWVCTGCSRVFKVGLHSETSATICCGVASALRGACNKRSIDKCDLA